MGKGAANPYPGWWASSEGPTMHDTPGDPLPDCYKGIPAGFTPKDFRYEWEKDYKSDFRNFFFFFDEDPFTHNQGKRSHPFDPYEEEEFESEDENDPYYILGVTEQSSPQEIRKAYHDLIRIHHPDKGGTKQDFIKIQGAWEYINLYEGVF